MFKAEEPHDNKLRLIYLSLKIYRFISFYFFPKWTAAKTRFSFGAAGYKCHTATNKNRVVAFLS